MKPKYLNFLTLKSLVVTVLSSFLLFACQSNTPQSQPTATTPNKPVYTPEPQNLASEGQAIELARDLIKENAIESAIGILKQYILDDLNLNDQQLYVLARAELAVARNDSQEAKYWVSGQYAHLFNRASKVKQMTLRFLKSDVAAMEQDYLSAARERIFIDGELYGEDKQVNHDIIWTHLLKLSIQDVERFIRNSGSQNGAYGALDIVGWLQLTYQLKSVKAQIYAQQQKLELWVKSNQSHPAAQLLPSPLKMLMDVHENQPSQIAVLVPLSGKYAVVGRSIQAGIMSEYYNVAASNRVIPKIVFYDTGVDQLNIIDLYNQAVNNGAEFVIGPFFEKPVNELANYQDLTVPVLFLRSVQGESLVSENTLQFDLSLSHEVSRLATQAYADGHRNIALIYTKNSSKRKEFAQIFEQTFTQLGGTVVVQTQLDTSTKYIFSVKELMGIDDSEQRAQAIYKLLDQSVSNFEVRPRDDIDAIFMVVSQVDSVRLKPIFNQQYASEIPFYALSEIYTGGQLPKQYDLDNIRLQSTPWQLQGVTHNDLPQRDEIASVYQANEVYITIAALGVDAYSIMMQFDIFKAFEGNTLSGVNGILYQPEDGVIQVKRDWIIINNNKITNYDVSQ